MSIPVLYAPEGNSPGGIFVRGLATAEHTAAIEITFMRVKPGFGLRGSSRLARTISAHALRHRGDVEPLPAPGTVKVEQFVIAKGGNCQVRRQFTSRRSVTSITPCNNANDVVNRPAASDAFPAIFRITGQPPPVIAVGIQEMHFARIIFPGSTKPCSRRKLTESSGSAPR